MIFYFLHEYKNYSKENIIVTFRL